ncbi:unnamed protein product [Dovyalis caffra]|uniref:Uncharacterized protein n=1 Tax=Dovyalis caffra TaxID=77055 RepID=A0AAV1RG66_9ROSI|nr:unnamed protein product [Dovyalis caffra]
MKSIEELGVHHYDILWDNPPNNHTRGFGMNSEDMSSTLHVFDDFEEEEEEWEAMKCHDDETKFEEDIKKLKML